MNMKCDICGQNGASIRKVARTFGSGKNLLVIENIPVINCSKCGESYMTAETLHEIERIKIHEKSIAIERRVKVAGYI